MKGGERDIRTSDASTVFRFVQYVNRKFNECSKSAKQAMTVVFSAFVGFICLSMILQLNKSNQALKTESITTPEIPMNEFNENQKLIPLGKMKGEVEGKFDSFYVAIDNQGKLYMNRDLNYGENAYTKDERWKTLSIKELKEYERHLHFIPMRSKGLKY